MLGAIDTATLVELIVGFAALFGTLVAIAWKLSGRLTTIEASMESHAKLVNEELTANGGESLKDKVNSNNRQLKDLQRQMKKLRKQVADSR